MNRAEIQRDLSLDYAGTEAINTICSNLTFSGRNIKKIVVTSCEANDGKSFVSIQVAANMAKRGKRVLLMDADLRLSVMVAHYDIRLGGEAKGLAHFLSGQCQLEEATYVTNIPNLYLIPIGTDVQTPLSLISTPDFEKLVDVLGESFDMVVIDAPPIGLVIDAAEIAKKCDGSVIVLEYNKTHRRALQEAQQQMLRTGTPILGCVLNKVSLDRLSTRKYYSQYGMNKYGYGYGYGRGNGYYRRNEKEGGKK